MRRTLVVLCLLLTALAAAAEPRLYYRYRNAEGRTVLDYHVPTEALQHGYQVIDTYGRVVRTVPPPKTPEELATLKREEAARKEREQRAREQAAADRQLLHTYPREADLVKARDANLTALDDQLRLSRLELERLKGQLDGQMSRAARHERSGEAVPASLLADIERSRRQMEEREAFIKEREEQREELKAQFTRDITRYRELMALSKEERHALLNPPPEQKAPRR